MLANAPNSAAVVLQCCRVCVRQQAPKHTSSIASCAVLEWLAETLHAYHAHQHAAALCVLQLSLS